MPDTTPHNDTILAAAASSLAAQRAGGIHRRPVGGRGARRLRWQNRWRRLKLLLVAIFAILLTASVAGLVLDGIGFEGVMLTFLAIVAATAILARWPRVKVPERATLARTRDARQLVAQTELWLDHQRPALPAPALTLVDQLSVQLDALGAQLAHVDPAHPAAGEVRKLVGEYLPETIETWRRIPAQLRREERAGSTPEAQLVESLAKISHEIDTVTRQLAEGDLDQLAIRNRFLEYRYGGALAAPPASLPPRD